MLLAFLSSGSSRTLAGGTLLSCGGDAAQRPPHSSSFAGLETVFSSDALCGRRRVHVHVTASLRTAFLRCSLCHQLRPLAGPSSGPLPSRRFYHLSRYTAHFLASFWPSSWLFLWQWSHSLLLRLLLWSPPLSLQAFSQWGGSRVLQPLVAHLGTSQFPDNNPTAYFPME